MMDFDDISAYAIRILLFIAGLVLLFPITIDAFNAMSPKPQVIHHVNIYYTVYFQPAALPWIILILTTLFDGVILMVLALLFNGLSYTINREEIEYQSKPFLAIDKNSGDQGYYFIKLKRALLIVLSVTLGIIVVVMLSAAISYIERFIPWIILSILPILLILAINRVETFTFIRSRLISNAISISLIILFLLVCISASFSIQ